MKKKRKRRRHAPLCSWAPISKPSSAFSGCSWTSRRLLYIWSCGAAATAVFEAATIELLTTFKGRPEFDWWYFEFEWFETPEIVFSTMILQAVHHMYPEGALKDFDFWKFAIFLVSSFSKLCAWSSCLFRADLLFSKLHHRHHLKRSAFIDIW